MLSYWSNLSSKTKRILFIVLAMILLSILLPYQFTSLFVQKYQYQTLDEIKEPSVGLLLGTSKYQPGAQKNLFYKYRIQKAAELYHQGKIKHILVSGDNAHRSYDEPTNILKDLLKRGVKREDITLDYAGFRTLDSVLRAHQVFGLHSFIIISQKFHIERALFIARSHNLQAHGISAKSPQDFSHFKVIFREHFARLLMLWDLFIQTPPKFPGPPEPIQF